MLLISSPALVETFLLAKLIAHCLNEQLNMEAVTKIHVHLAQSLNMYRNAKIYNTSRVYSIFHLKFFLITLAQKTMVMALP